MVGDARAVFVADAKRHLHVGADEFHRRHLADVDAGDPDHGAAFEPLDVRELGLDLVALPREPALAANGKDEHGGKHQRGDGEDANLQFRPGEGSRSRHVSKPSYERNASM